MLQKEQEGSHHGRQESSAKPYLKLSTTLSRKTSAAQVELEIANYDLEDLILDELDGNRSGSVSGIVDHLNNSRLQLQGARTTISALRAEMTRLQYEDLPTLATVNLTELGHLLQKQRMMQGDLCRKLEIDRAYMSNVESGKKNPILATIERIVEVLSIPSDELIKEL